MASVRERLVAPSTAYRAFETVGLATLVVDAPADQAGAAGMRERHRTAAAVGTRLDALVLDAEFRQALAAIRSYGRTGLSAGAIVCEDRQRDALAHRSKWCRFKAAVPDFSLDADAYARELLGVLARQPTDVLLPCHDGSIEALRRQRAVFERRAALALAPERALEVAVDKRRTLALAQALGIPVPQTYEVRDASDLRQALALLGFPAVLKPVYSWVERSGTGTRLSCEPVTSLEDGVRLLDRIEAAGGHAIAQQWLSGRRDAVTVMYSGGRIAARFAQMSHRELPALGGASVLCESIHPIPDIVDPAERLVRAMELEGCSMVEFRRDAAGRPVLMEVNPRMAGSVALAIASGVDFPLLLRAWALGLPVPEIAGYRTGVRRRWLSGDIDHFKSALKSGRSLEVPSRLKTATRFIGDFVVRPSALDVFAADDPAPALMELRHTFRSALESVRRQRVRARERDRIRKAERQGHV